MATAERSNPATETEVAREVYAAINRNDIPAVLELFDPEIERTEPAGFPSSGTYRGHAEVEEHLSRGRGTWAEGSCEPEQFIVTGNKIVVFLHVRVRLHNSATWLDGRLADVLTFRNGKVVQLHSFADPREALTLAGGPAPDMR